jgi:hypothetical protein
MTQQSQQQGSGEGGEASLGAVDEMHMQTAGGSNNAGVHAAAASAASAASAAATAAAGGAQQEKKRKADKAGVSGVCVCVRVRVCVCVQVCVCLPVFHSRCFFVVYACMFM